MDDESSFLAILTAQREASVEELARIEARAKILTRRIADLTAMLRNETVVLPLSKPSQANAAPSRIRNKFGPALQERVMGVLEKAKTPLSVADVVNIVAPLVKHTTRERLEQRVRSLLTAAVKEGKVTDIRDASRSVSYKLC